MQCDKTGDFEVRFINLLVTNELSHPYHLDDSTVIFKGVRSNISFLVTFAFLQFGVILTKCFWSRCFVS